MDNITPLTTHHANATMQYRRVYHPGTCYFFTVVTHRGYPRVNHPEAVAQLRLAVQQVGRNSDSVLRRIIEGQNTARRPLVIAPEGFNISLPWQGEGQGGVI